MLSTSKACAFVQLRDAAPSSFHYRIRPMTSNKTSASSRLKKIARNVPSYDEARKILNRAQQEKGHAADRAAAIMGGAMVEDALRVAIKRRFDPAFPDDLLGDLFDYERKGPLPTLGYRILAG